MSDQAVVIDLEGLFLAREFGRYSGPALRAVEEDFGAAAPEPRELEELFLSRDFGRPVALTLIRGGDDPAPDVVEFPFSGPGARAFSPEARQRAVAVLSGAAAAVLVIAGLTAGGPHTPSTTSALGHSSQGNTAITPNGGSAPSPSTGAPAGAGFAGTASTAGSGSGSTSVVFAVQPVAVPAATPASSSAPPGGTPSGEGPAPAPAPAPAPGPPSGLAPANAIVGDTVAAAGSTVSSASGQVANAVPGGGIVAAPMASTGATLTALGDSIAAPSSVTVLGATVAVPTTGP